MSIDIIHINKLILEKFNQEISEVVHKIARLRDSDDDIIVNSIQEMKRYLATNCGKDLYISATLVLIQDYLKILASPLDRNASPTHTKKLDTINSYLSIVRRLIREKEWTDVVIPFNNSVLKFACPTCLNDNPSAFEIDETGVKTCLECAEQTKTIEVGHTHMDYSRVNITGKFVYNRVLHFQDCLKQFQGKQNCKIPEQLYKDLDAKFMVYRLLTDSNNFHTKYSRITKEHVMMFLKELKYVKHYENLNYIYFALTNKRPDHIDENLEKSLIEDFKKLIELYDNVYSKDKPDELERKNFMNVQYILFQLLKRHEYDCKIQDFSILKTAERKQFHDKICLNLFQKLGWKFTPTF